MPVFGFMAAITTSIFSLSNVVSWLILLHNLGYFLSLIYLQYLHIYIRIYIQYLHHCCGFNCAFHTALTMWTTYIHPFVYLMPFHTSSLKETRNDAKKWGINGRTIQRAGFRSVHYTLILDNGHFEGLYPKNETIHLYFHAFCNQNLRFFSRHNSFCHGNMVWLIPGTIITMPFGSYAMETLFATPVNRMNPTYNLATGDNFTPLSS